MTGKGNRIYWNKISDDYQNRHNKTLNDESLAWGVWRIPESELQVLGDISGKRVLEYGCGAAQWSVALAKNGASPIGLDLSERQLDYACKHINKEKTKIPLIQADGEYTPFRSSSFDIIFCDHGVMSFTRPESAIREVARILRPGGLFAFCMSSPLRDLCWDEETDMVTDHLQMNYFRMGKSEYQESTSYQYGYGKWIQLFLQYGFIIENLIEIRAPKGKQTSYVDFIPYAWARKWPAENIWKIRKK
jgi:ubiquinone/menaquinone biosynthesis C-methylase UbiE